MKQIYIITVLIVLSLLSGCLPAADVDSNTSKVLQPDVNEHVTVNEYEITDAAQWAEYSAPEVDAAEIHEQSVDERIKQAARYVAADIVQEAFNKTTAQDVLLNCTDEQLEITEYYGRYSGFYAAKAVCFFVDSKGKINFSELYHSDSPVSVNIAGYEITFPDNNRVFLCPEDPQEKTGIQYLYLSEAYEKGYITKKDVADIRYRMYEYHDFYGYDEEYWKYSGIPERTVPINMSQATPLDPPELSEDTAERIKSAFIQYRLAESGDEPYVNSITYYGRYNEGIIANVGVGYSYENKVVIGGYLFQDVGGLIYFKDDSVMPLAEAYNTGLLCKADVADAAYYANTVGAAPVYISEDWYK